MRKIVVTIGAHDKQCHVPQGHLGSNPFGMEVLELHHHCIANRQDNDIGVGYLQQTTCE